MNGDILSNEPILLFLHGVGTGDPEDRWFDRLSKTLIASGHPPLERTRVIAPKYAHALKGWDERVPLPAVTVKLPTRDAARQNRRDFERRMGAVEFRLGRHDRGNGYPGGDATVGLAVELPPFKQAHKYLNDPQIRAYVLNRIIDKLPQTGRIVIVGHSLGSVIAADLVRRLPTSLRVAGMITIGSPLANGGFDVDKLGEALKDPPSNLDWWVNFWNRFDPVAAHRGISSVFPWMVDLPIQTPAGVHVHDAVDYLGDELVAEAIGFAMFGSKSKVITRVDSALDIPLDDPERLALLALRYAHLIKIRLTGELHDRFDGALRRVQASLIESLIWRAQDGNRPVPHAIARLAVDFADVQADLPVPHPSSHFTKDEVALPLTILATDNVVRPFEIAVPREKLQAAMEDLTAEMGLGSPFGTAVFASAKGAQVALSGGSSLNWKKWSALGVGAAALVVATGGLALAAAPGLVGAAVVTSALASFGPGGMIGGLLTAGTLVGAGGGGIAFGLASPGTSAETLEAIVARQLALAILRHDQLLEQDNAMWSVLVETEIKVSREHEQLDEFSDPSSPSLKELCRKLEAIQRALKFMRDNGLEPYTPHAQDDLS